MRLSLQLNLFGGARDPSGSDDDVTFDESIKNSQFNLNQTLKEHQHTTQRCCVCAFSLTLKGQITDCLKAYLPALSCN